MLGGSLTADQIVQRLESQAGHLRGRGLTTAADDWQRGADDVKRMALCAAVLPKWQAKAKAL